MDNNDWEIGWNDATIVCSPGDQPQLTGAEIQIWFDTYPPAQVRVRSPQTSGFREFARYVIRIGADYIELRMNRSRVGGSWQGEVIGFSTQVPT